MDKFLARVYAKKVTEFDPQIVAATAEILKDAIKEGYDATLKDFAPNSPDFGMLENLQNNVYQFAAAKSYQELKLATELLTDESGNVKPFPQFRADAEGLFKKFNEDWLDSEYSTAISSTLNAREWASYTKTAKAMPYLRYSTVGDSKVRESHRSLDGVVKRIDDAFWDSSCPPNGFRCRCGTTQTGQGKETTSDSITLPYVDPMFKTNLAKTGLLFPKNHPYFDGVPKQVLRKAMAYLPPENAFTTITVNGATIEEHAMLQYESPETRQKNREIAAALKINGVAKNIKLIPAIHKNDVAARELIYGKKYSQLHPTKCPDAIIDNSIVEFKYASERNMAKRVAEAAAKANVCVISLTFNATDEQLERFATGQLNKIKSLEEIVFIVNGKVKRLRR